MNFIYDQTLNTIANITSNHMGTGYRITRKNSKGRLRGSGGITPTPSSFDYITLGPVK